MKIQANGVNLFYKVAGQGAPLLLLHGNGEDHSIFDKLMPRLAEHFRVCTLDSRNHGQSQITHLYSYDVMAEDVYAFIQALGLGPVHLLGFSDGGILGLLLAMRHGECLRSMALLGANLTPDDMTKECHQLIQADYDRTKDPLLKLMLEQPNIQPEQLRGVDTPTLLVAAENDIYKPEAWERLCAALPHAQTKIMAGHDHGSYVIHQDVLYPELMAFFV